MILGSLAVNIVANVDKFISGINKATTDLGRFVEKIGVVRTAIGGFLAFELVRMVQGFGRFLDSMVAAGSELHTLTQRLGITANEFQRLSYAAIGTGLSTPG